MRTASEDPEALESLTSSMPWNRPPIFSRLGFSLPLIARVRCLLGPISAEMKTCRVLSSVTTSRSTRGFGCVQTQEAPRVTIYSIYRRSAPPLTTPSIQFVVDPRSERHVDRANDAFGMIRAAEIAAIQPSETPLGDA